MACAICNTRREKRHCPGVEGEICAICCGEQREETIACPFDCEYLKIAHQSREKKDPAALPNPDSRISREFMQKNLQLIIDLEDALLLGALERNAVDDDVKEALDGLTRTYKTLGSGLYYESRPVNPVAAAIYAAIERRVDEIRRAENERGVHKILDSHILSILIFLQQMEYTLNNGRKRGRSYLDSLRTAMAETMRQAQPEPSSLIVT